MIFNRTFVSAILGLTLTAGYTAANASFTSCASLNPDITSRVSTATDCDILDPIGGNPNPNNPNTPGQSANDSPQPGFVNQELFFGFNDWQYDGKAIESDPNNALDLFSFTGDATSGSFTYLVNNNIDFTHIMFVFKDGADTNLVGYLVTAADGTYSNPFTEPPFTLSGGSTSHDISHISVYFRDGGGPPVLTPEPGSLALLGLGLVGLVAVARRRR